MKVLLREYYTEINGGIYPTRIVKVVRKMSMAEAAMEKEKEEQKLINWLYTKDKQIYNAYSKYIGLTHKENQNADTI